MYWERHCLQDIVLRQQRVVIVNIATLLVVLVVFALVALEISLFANVSLSNATDIRYELWA